MAVDALSFPRLPDPPSQDVLDELLTYEVAWITDAMGLHLMDREIRNVHPQIERVVGPAVTVAVPPGDFLFIPAALNQTRQGDVLVIDGRGATSRAVWGDYFSTWAQGMGVKAVIIDGATRDVGGIERLRFPVFTRGTTSRGPTMNGPGEVNVPVSCGGVCVQPGDLVVADREGVVVIPLRRLDDLLRTLRAAAEGHRTHYGHPATGRADYETYFSQFFAPRIAALRPPTSSGEEQRPGSRH
jgi:4-hydroxy-4-methyl-2-oxoglutarate aldolase